MSEGNQNPLKQNIRIIDVVEIAERIAILYPNPVVDLAFAQFIGEILDKTDWRNTGGKMIFDENFWAEIRQQAIQVPPGNYFEMEEFLTRDPLVNNQSTETQIFVMQKEGRRLVILAEDVPRSDRLSEENVSPE